MFVFLTDSHELINYFIPQHIKDPRFGKNKLLFSTKKYKIINKKSLNFIVSVLLSFTHFVLEVMKLCDILRRIFLY